MSLNSFSTAIHGRLPRTVVDIAILAMLNHSQSVQSHTGLSFCSQDKENSHLSCIVLITSTNQRNKMKLTGNTVLITGGSSGIGLEIAKRFLKRDNTVIITGRNERKLQQAREQFEGLTVIQNDVSNPEDIATLFQRIEKDFPDLNILINNAGIMRKINLQNHSDSALELTKEIDINIKGLVWMSNAFLSLLKEKKNAAIVNVSSGLAFVPLPISPVYCAAKAAVHSYTLSLREQLRNTGIKVFELAPPATNTELLTVFGEEMEGTTIMSTEAMVGTFFKGLSKDQYEIRPGQSNLLKFMSRFFPNFILKQLSKSVELMHADKRVA